MRTPSAPLHTLPSSCTLLMDLFGYMYLHDDDDDDGGGGGDSSHDALECLFGHYPQTSIRKSARGRIMIYCSIGAPAQWRL